MDERIKRKEPLREGKEPTRDKLYTETTYRFLSLVSFGSIDGVVIFSNVQVEIVLIRKVLVTFAASVHVNLLVMHIVVFDGIERQRLVRR
jgi:hypothetical protein